MSAEQPLTEEAKIGASSLRSRSVMHTARLAEATMLVCLCLLIVHTVFLSHGEALLKSTLSKVVTKPDEILHFDLENCDLQGAEFYVNGVCLGTLPLTITQAEFMDKVPVWSEQPEFLDHAEIPEWLNQYRPSGGFHPRGESLFYPISDSMFDSDKTEYYAQVKYQGQWCYAGRGGSGGGRRREKHRGIEFISPPYEQKLEQLLDIARIKDYRVSESWFEAMDSYGLDGVQALLKAGPDEPGLGDLLDHWAIWRFGLDRVDDQSSAWQAFERICRTVTRARAYSTEGLEGRAVTLLAPKLPVRPLTRQAVGLVKSASSLGGKLQWEVGGKSHFGVTYEGARYASSLGRHFHYMETASGAPPVSGYAVAHALWCLFEQGDVRARDAFENHVVPEMIARYYPRVPRYPVMGVVGGPSLERYLLRQNWDDFPSTEVRSGLDPDYKNWILVCAQLETEAGDQFRRGYREMLFQMADQVNHWARFNEVDYLFVDLDQGTESLAFQYWPRFLERVLDKWRGFMLTEVLFEYLIKMDPLSEPRMYVDVFQAETRQHDLVMALEKLSQLPLSRRQAVCAALKDAIAQDVSHLDLRAGQTEDKVRRQLLSELDELLVSDQDRAQRLYDKLAENQITKFPVNWLRQLTEDHPVVPMLAQSDRADLRRQALYAIEAHPSPAHRALLESLLEDSDVEVRSAAKAVAQKLDDLANMSLEILKAN